MGNLQDQHRGIYTHPHLSTHQIYIQHAQWIGNSQGAMGYRNNENEDTAGQDIPNTPERSPRAQVCSVYEGLVHMDQGKGCSQLIPSSLTGSFPKPIASLLLSKSPSCSAAF